MTNVDELKARELELLNEDKNVLDLETLIVDGENAKIHVEVDFPEYKDGEIKHSKYGAIIKPLTSSVFTNATQIGLKNPATDVNTEIVKAGLCTKTGEPFPAQVVTRLPAGVIIALAEKICEVSGIQANEEDQAKFVRDMMGF